MQQRIGFKSDGLRKEFFASAREASGVKSWNELKDLLGLPRTSFQHYQYGRRLLPSNVFDLMLHFLSEEKQQFFFKQTFTKPQNWGAVKGGVQNSEKNRDKLLEHLERVRCKRVQCKPLSRPVDLSQPLSKDLCEFIGAIIGDGCIDGYVNEHGRSHYHISITGDAELDKDYLTNRISSISANLFKLEPHFYFRKDSRAIVLNFYSKWIFSLFTKRFGFIAGNKAYTVKIPDEIMSSSEEFVFATIRGISDTDGCVFIDNRKIYNNAYGRIVLKTVSKPLYEQLNEFLQKHFSLYSAAKKQRDGLIFEITIYGNKQIEKWMQLIGFSNERRLCKIRALLMQCNVF